jgi:hypothetical protein
LEGFLGKKFGFSPDKINQVLNRPTFLAGMKSYEAAIKGEKDLTGRLGIDKDFDVKDIKTTYFRNIAGEVIKIVDDKTVAYGTVDTQSPKDSDFTIDTRKTIETKYANEALTEPKSKIANFIMKDINPTTLLATLTAINTKAPYNKALSEAQSTEQIKTTLSPTTEKNPRTADGKMDTTTQ